MKLETSDRRTCQRVTRRILTKYVPELQTGVTMETRGRTEGLRREDSSEDECQGRTVFNRYIRLHMTYR